MSDWLHRATCLSLLSLSTSTCLAADAERWHVVIDLWGNPVHQSLVLERDGDVLAGRIDGDPLTGQADGDRRRFIARANGSEYRFDGVLRDGRLVGTADFPDPNHDDRRATHAFTARRLPERIGDAPRRHEFAPVDYSNEFSAQREPVLTIWPGDRVHTRTLDSGGVDEHGVTRALFGNPQTGPFYVMGAEPGDVLVVHLEELRLDRDHADSLDDLVGRARGNALAGEASELGRTVRWTLDRERGVARPMKRDGALRDVEIPLRPMLGGLGVAPGFGWPPASTGDSGRFGGNMDFNGVVEGSSVHLPVAQPGALLYLGDAHAAQGDGETSQYGLETSMDVTFRVELIKATPLIAPRIESATHRSVLGQAGSLDEALRVATSGLIQWLRQDYDLTLSDAAQLLGVAVEYRVATLAGRNAGMVAALPKSVLRSLPRRKS